MLAVDVSAEPCSSRLGWRTRGARARPLGRELVRAVLHAALDAVITIDGKGRIVEFNPAAERCFGYPARDALGRELAYLIVPPTLRDRHRAGLARHLAGAPPVMSGRRTELMAQRATGEQFPVELTITKIALDDEGIFVAYLRDLSGQRRAEAELQASRARMVAAADDARRRIERDLHDGAQQRLVALALTLRLARIKAGRDPAQALALIDEAMDELAAATAELRELARGIHPLVLTEGGLEPALAGLAGRANLPVAITGPPGERLPAEVEATAYFVVAEALTNLTRHARATHATISVERSGATLDVRVRDDGRGGAELAGGLGLVGLADRVAALGGTLTVDSPPGAGTTVRAQLPCAS
jgi:PAS domain S-box-containing protein